MKFVLFYHSLVSDWNHGNAHFLRGIAAELLDRGHDVVVYEPFDAWSVRNLVADHGEKPLDDFRLAFPHLKSIRYDTATIDARAATAEADVVMVHEWNEHELVRRIGDERRRGAPFRLLFHDTHHRAATEPASMEAYDLSGYDGVLAYGAVIRDMYLQRGWTARAWTWHEAADTRVFHPRPRGEPAGDVVWIGNWGDDERSAELREFLIEPVRKLRLRAHIHGVRYPEKALRLLKKSGIEYAGWLPNHKAPEVFSRFRLTVHVPRRPYVRTLHGVPTIRPFEALACGIPLLSAPWEDSEELFTAGADYLLARNGKEMQELMRDVLNDDELATSLASHGLATIEARHTCRHRVDELMGILTDIGVKNDGQRVAGSG